MINIFLLKYFPTLLKFTSPQLFLNFFIVIGSFSFIGSEPYNLSLLLDRYLSCSVTVVLTNACISNSLRIHLTLDCQSYFFCSQIMSLVVYNAGLQLRYLQPLGSRDHNSSTTSSFLIRSFTTRSNSKDLLKRVLVNLVLYFLFYLLILLEATTCGDVFDRSSKDRLEKWQFRIE